MDDGGFQPMPHRDREAIPPAGEKIDGVNVLQDPLLKQGAKPKPAATL